MKKLFAWIITCTAPLAATSQSAAVLHHNNTATPFYGNTCFQDAYTASVSGDTIYLPGGFFIPPNPIDKRLAVIGAGHHPDSSSATLITYINGDISFGPNAGGSFITGFNLSGSIITPWNAPLNNLNITRLYINGAIAFQGDRTTPCLNGTIKDCIIVSEMSGNNASQFTFTNNIILYRISNMGASIVTNNIFLGGDDIGGTFRTIYNTNQSIIRNNIFYNPVFDFSGCSNNQFQNNVFTNNPPLTNNIASGNYISVTPANIFVTYANDGFKYTNNYHLKTPASYPGTDALQVGLYGTAKPWKEGSVPLNPHIQSKIIAENADSNGLIQVQVKVAAQNQ